MPGRVGLLCLCLMAGLAGPIGQASAQGYPSRSVKLVVPVAAGGALDITGRLVAQRLGSRLGQSFIIENKPGQGTSLGANDVAKSPPDGYTLLLASSSSLAINATLNKKLAYNPAEDLVPVGMIAESALALIVKPSLPIASVREYIDYSKKNTDALTYASAGVGSPHHLFMELFKTMTGAQAKHVPYRGGLPALNDLIGGHVDSMLADLPPSLEMIKAGKVRALAISSARRSRVLPDLPTIAEGGVPGYGAAAWLALAAPSAVPRPILEVLFSEISTFVALPETEEQLNKFGLTGMTNVSLEESRKFMLSEIKRWGEVVKASGATAE